MADASNGLQTLLSSKAALDLGLITQEDFDQVKASFLKAQQIKAAVDVGLIKNEDYDATKNEFLNSLGAVSLNNTTAPTSNRAAAAPSVAPRAPPAPKPAPVVAAAVATPVAAAATAAAVAAAPKPAPAPPPPPAVVSQPPSQPSSQPPSRPASTASLARTGSNPDVPSNIPKMGGLKGMQQGTSMSGIACSEDAVNLFYLIKAKAAYQWALWQIDDAGHTVIINAVGAKGESYADFLAAMPETDCRYGLYDYQFTGPDGQVHNKLVFFNWAPDNARVKSKMMYASTKDFFKSHLDGISVEFQVSEPDEITEQEVADACLALKR